ncbi:MAG: hypothetical protein PHP72_03565 [Dysgonamonadaceae bacterium]|nr:hypothetical protein [Dysgonamonadaceae bacterium]MDD4605755.1 hypothetical protein [Dysgonamonadaceae bacterium]HTO16589.1 hypothetical protein [Edaphocola sp.]
MKIGVLIKEFEKLSNWELRIIEKIINDKELELSLLIQDGREGNEIEKSQGGRFKRLIKSENSLGKLIFKIQILIERKLFREYHTINKGGIINKLKTVETVYLKPKRRGSLDIFSSVDAEKIKSYNLDIILRLEFNIIKGDILNSAKYGVWSLHYADNSINHGGPAGFWEILHHHTSVGVTLQQLTPELNGGLIIDKAFFNYHWSFAKTNRLILEASVSLLFKNIRQLQIGNYSPTESTVYYNSPYKAPNLANLIKYIFGFYSKLRSKIFGRVKYLLFGIRYDCWTLWIGKGDFLNSTLFRLNPIKLPKNEFWADPFIFNYKGDNYIFFENYNYSTKRGKISCGRIKDDELVDVTDVLDLDYHLSYPFIFEENGDVFLMPESSENKRLEIYKCISFPNKWELYSTAFEGEMVADASFYVDNTNQRWLFINKQDDLNSAMENELFIYRVDSLKLELLEPHLQNPVIINSETARNGGAIFKYRDEIYRPSQANIEGVYGRALNINKIERLTIEEYVEKTTVTTYPNFHKGLIAMHHLHQVKDLFVIDAAYREK